jgi:ribosomal protein L25 (general stress protein Ctc)
MVWHNVACVKAYKFNSYGATIETTVLKTILLNDLEFNPLGKKIQHIDDVTVSFVCVSNILVLL